MKSTWLSRTDDPELCVIFGGWAIGSGPFEALNLVGNILFVDDYRDLSDDLPDVGNFDHVTLLAHSFGVASAAHWLAGRAVDRLVGVAGTLFPADPDRGIAPDMISATADNLTPASFARFCRRAGLNGPVPDIICADRADELLLIAERGPAPDPGFDKVWIPSQDRIIPTPSQQLAWEDGHEIDAPHIPFQAGQKLTDWLK